ncbi:arylamine N-acetyltransferase [Corallococcus sp. H22C18031201]|nr:arylamine N-acetyltransferase [Corallococcus sp. H22C18031201]
MSLEAYLERLGHVGPVRVDLETLDSLHRAHVGTLPFENLDIHLGLPIRVDLPSVEAKLVGARRGGYCFEQNTLFHSVLSQVGFRVHRTIGRVIWGRERPGARTHQVLRVELGGREWLADVGFGGNGLISPMPLEVGREHEAHGERWRLVESQWVPGYELHLLIQDEWKAMFIFDPREPVLDLDIESGNHFTSTFPESHFVKSRVLARCTPGVRRTMLNAELKIRRGASVEVRQLQSEAEYREVLEREFLLVLPDGARLRPLPELAPG